jgi:membrane-associated phospholipid phosphatase
MLVYTLDGIGFFGPIIVFLLNIYLLRLRYPYLLAYLVFFFMNKYVNKILKLVIKQARPDGGISFINESYTGADKYGMPSGHAQSIMFSTFFLYFVTGSNLFLIIELFIGTLTLYQRWKYRRHTVEQLCVGSIFGIFISYFSFYVTKKYLSNADINEI